MLTKEEIQKFEEQLKADEARLESEIKELGTPTDFGDAPDGGDEESDEDEEFENKSGAADSLKDRLVEVQLALAKIPSGKYGICETCEEQIEKDVLEASPESRLCKSCKIKVK